MMGQRVKMAASLKTLAFLSMFFINFVQLGSAVPFHMENLNVLADAEECKDERDCQWIVTESEKHGREVAEYCELYKDAASVKQCPRTCGFCKAPAPIECKDERNCEWIVKQAEIHGRDVADYCEAYKDTAPIKQCRKTCRMCKAPAPSDCQDERSDCENLITKTGGGAKLEVYCNKWKDDPAVKQCPKTCNMCDRAPSPVVKLTKRVEECKDDRDCQWIVTESEKHGREVAEYCELYKDAASVKQCRKTCGFCKAPAPIECKDERDCQWIVAESEKYGREVAEYCELYKDAASVKQCPRTCGFCKAPFPSDCQDERSDCENLITKTGGGAKLEEYCNKWKDDPAVKQCPKTCNMCDSAPSSVRRSVVKLTKRVADCKDERSDCNRIAEITGGGEKLERYCNKWKDDPAVKQCPKTCGMCQEKAPSPIECKDERNCDWIVKQAEKYGRDVADYCEAYKDTAPIKQCLKTCRMCKAPSPIGCKDERSDCNRIAEITGGGEKLERYCNKWKDDPAVKQCPKTCNMCSKPPAPPSREPPETQSPTKKPTAAPKPTQAPGEGPTGFQKACLEAHNDYRFFHRAPPLKWSAELTRDAQAWANHLAANNLFDHDPTARPKDQGENLYSMTYPKRLCDLDENGPDCLSCGEMVKMWYDEELDYDYVTGKAKVAGAPILHFTQIVWKASKEMGMATAVANNRLVAVARYTPAGNIDGQFQENVLVPNYP
ncbi:uncharacterized protein LOC144649745 isoform X3 [Oculina patagonica]